MDTDINGEIGERGAYKTGNSSSPNPNANTGANFSHEAMSLKIIDFMVDQNGIDIERDDVRFVQSLIDGVPYVGAKNELDEGRMWMYDIVANKRNSIDVDKWDYLARDCYGLGIKSSYDHSRLMTYSRVIDGEICYHAKEAYNIYEMFHTRYSLFKQVYSHRVGKAIEYMIGDAFDLADEELGISEAIHDVERYTSFLTDNLLRTIESSRSPTLKTARDIIGRIRRRDLYKMVDEVLIDPKHFDSYKTGITPSRLADSSAFIANNTSIDLLDDTLPMSSSGYIPPGKNGTSVTAATAAHASSSATASSLPSETIPGLRVPQPKRSGATTPPIPGSAPLTTPHLHSILHTYPNHSRRYGTAGMGTGGAVTDLTFFPLPESAFRVNSFTCNYAHKDKNPVDSVHFFSKWDDTTSFKLEREKVSLLIPSTFSERYLRVYVTDASNIPLAQQSFRHLLTQIGDAQPGPQHTISRTDTPAFISATSSGTGAANLKRRSSSKSSLNAGLLDSPSPSKKSKHEDN